VRWTSLPAKPLLVVTSFCGLAAANSFLTFRLFRSRRRLAALAGVLLTGLFLGG